MTKQEIPLIFELDELSQSVQVCYVPGMLIEEVTEEQLVKTIKKAGFHEYDILIDNVRELQSKILNHELCVIEVAKKIVKLISIDVSEDLMYAYIDIVAPDNDPVTKEEIEKSLISAGIAYGILAEEIENLANEKEAKQRIIAKGDLAIRGEPSRFEPLIQGAKQDYKERTQEQDDFEYEDEHAFSTVESGTELMRRHPPTEGKDGKNVFGMEVKGEPGEVINFPENLTGTKISEEDSNLLVAKIKGHPVIEANNVRVDKAYVVETVNEALGNIDFDGSLHVKGDVEPGMVINVTGDITVKGSVKRAILTAGKNITVEQGINGGEAKIIEHEDGSTTEDKNAIIKCEGTLTTLFIDNANVDVGGSIVVKDFIFHSDIIAKNEILVGGAKGKGNIVGGNLYAGNFISAIIVGSPANVQTIMSVGISDHDKEEYENMQEHMLKNEQHLRELSEALIEMGKKEQEGQLDNNLKSNLFELIKDLKKLAPEEHHLLDDMHMMAHKISNAREPRMKVKKLIHKGTLLYVRGVDFEVKEDSVGGTVILGHDKKVTIKK